MPQHFEIQESTAEALDSQNLYNSGGQIEAPFGVRICVGKPSAAIYSLDIRWDMKQWRLYFSFCGATLPIAARILLHPEPHELPEVYWAIPSPPIPMAGVLPPGFVYYRTQVDEPVADPVPELEPKPVKAIHEMELEDYRRGIDKLWKRGVTR